MNEEFDPETLKVGDRVQHVDGAGSVYVIENFWSYPLVTLRSERTGRECSANLYYLRLAVGTRTDGAGNVSRRDYEMGNGFTLREHIIGGGRKEWSVYRGAFIRRYKTERGARRAIERMKAQDNG